MCDGDFINLNRKLLDWEWFKDTKTLSVWVFLLLKANWKSGRFKGVEIPRGSLATSYPSISNGTGLSIQNVRTALEHLKSTGELTVKAYHDFSVITVLNYDRYQFDNSQTNRQLTGNQQATNRQLTTIETRNKGNKETSKHIYGEYKHVRLTDSEYEKLTKDLGTSMRDACIKYLDEYIEMKGYKANSHNLAIRKWVIDAVKKKGVSTSDFAGQRDGYDEQGI